MKFSARFTANTRVIRCVVFKDRKTDVFITPNVFVRLFQSSMIALLTREVVAAANCFACFVVASFSVVPRTPATSLILRDIKAEPLSKMSVVSKHA